MKKSGETKGKKTMEKSPQTPPSDLPFPSRFEQHHLVVFAAVYKVALPIK